MMICPKQPQFPLNPPSAHRRHPSAPPAVVVHPTRTPGLLSLSKPPRSAPHRQQQSQQRQGRTPKSKSATHHMRPTQLGQSMISDDPFAKPLVDAAYKTKIHLQTTITPLPSPEKGPRGRQQAKPAKDKPIRRVSASFSPAIARRNNTRQPSPPIQPHSQAEGTAINHPSSQFFAQRDRNPTSNLFDPFLVTSTSDTDSGSDNAQPQIPSKPATLRPAPTLAPLPSGKLARRRQPMPSTPTPLPSRAVPVPRGARHHSNHTNLSRSDSVLSYMPLRPTNRRSAMTAPTAVAQWDAFPICDDTTDAGMSPPGTPVRGKPADMLQQRLIFHNGPQTAPLARTSTFPFGGYSTPSPSPTPSRSHAYRHTPNDAVFNMSFDEDSDSSEGLKVLFGLTKRSPDSVRVGNKDKAGYFASSMFQNSPSPDELPPPSF